MIARFNGDPRGYWASRLRLDTIVGKSLQRVLST
jgi:hypothetical protein